MMKRMYMILLVLISATHLTTWADTRNTASAILHGQGLLWKIEKPGMLSSHIFGTMHVSDPRVTQMPPDVDKAFEDADQFVMEMLPSPRAMEVIAQGSYFQDGRRLKHLMEAEDYLRLSRVLTNNLQLPETLYSQMRPWAVLMLVSMPAEDMASNKVLDMLLYHRAEQRGMDLYGLETAQQQLAALESPTLEEQLWLLNKSVARYPQLKSDVRKMLALYLQRDLDGLVALQQQHNQSDSEIDDRFMSELLDKRNHRMVARLQSLLQQGNLFIAIGALHLPGNNGVLHLLEQQGYKVTPVY
ncbi:MAG TPA: TraB/GumN family protein [Gammaproteobacteria bacterium]|nr:TraB/GumN family protein [Gammaproteobacteria bacterium]